MKRMIIVVAMCLLGIVGIVSADTFDSSYGLSQFDIDFVTISGDASSANGTAIGSGKTFADPSNDYRMGMFEITNYQFAKFATNSNVNYMGVDVPSNRVSWFEAAKFVNYLNTSTGNPAAYKFSGSTMSAWDVLDNGYDASNPFRNSNAKYFLPTEDEWVKAAYWNGTSLQTYATKSGESLSQGNGTSGTGWNFHNAGYATDPAGLWNVGSGSEELNGTFDMMGNVWEWMESPYSSGDYLSGSSRGVRGGSYGSFGGSHLSSSYRFRGTSPYSESSIMGFRVASVPEPATLLLLGLGGLVLRRRRA